MQKEKKYLKEYLRTTQNVKTSFSTFSTLGRRRVTSARAKPDMRRNMFRSKLLPVRPRPRLSSSLLKVPIDCAPGNPVLRCLP